MNIRVTGQTQTSNAIAYIGRQSAAAARYTDQLSSGRRVKLGSDDPTNYPALLRAKAESLRFDAYTQTTADATADLDTSVSALQDVNQVLTRARQIATEGADATTTAEGQQALASEVDALVSRLLSAANGQAEGKYLFGGTATATQPFQVTATDAQGRPLAVAYAGSTDRARVLIGPGQTADTKYVGSAVFQQPGADVFQTLISLRDTLRDGTVPPGAKNGALNQRLAEIGAAQDGIGQTVGEQSAQLAALEGIKSRLDDLKLAADARASDLESTDVAAAVVRLQEQQTALQATMAVSARLFQPSLLDFIR